MSDKIIELTEDSFKGEAVESKLPVLVDFWAPWCGPCKMISPIIDEISQEYVGKIKFSKVNVDDCPQLATTFNVMSIPTLIFFKEGKEIGRIVGVVEKSKIKQLISRE